LTGHDPSADAAEEIDFHLEMRVQEYVRSGMSEQEARAVATRRMGDLEQARRECDETSRRARRATRRREGWGELAQDLRYGARTLLRAPTFTVMSLVTLALGIGATTAIFSLVHAVLLAPLPYAQPDRLVRVWERSPQGSERNVVSPGNVVDWRRNATAFSVIGAHRAPYGVTLTEEGEAERVVIAGVQPAVVEALGVPPVLGRSLLEVDGRDGGVALLSHAFWETRYGGDPGVLGRRLELNDIPYSVIGVMPEGFDFPSGGVDLWLAITDDALDPMERTSHNYMVLGLLAPDVSLERAQTEMSALAERIAADHPAQMTGWGVNVVPLHDDMTRNVRALFLVLLGGVAVVLLIVCTNLANLLLARAVSRRREIAVRGALGAGRARLVRQLLTESGVLAVLGGLGGALLAPLLLRTLIASAPAGIPLLDRASIDARMLAFTAAASLGCALLFGLAPSLRASKAGLDGSLRDGRDAGGAGHAGLRGGLLVAQVALSVVLLVGAGLFVRSFRALQATELGFDPDQLVLMDVDLPAARYAEIPEQVAFYRGLIDAVLSVPGVDGAATTSHAPGWSAGTTFSFAIEGRVNTSANGREDDETLHAVSPGYFEVLGHGLTEGRTFDGRDDAAGAPVAIINESLARKHWPRGDAIGSRIAFRVGDTPWREIVGVVSDARLASPDIAPEPGVYIPFAQKTWPWLTWSTVVARVAAGTDPASVTGRLRSALLELDPALPPQSMGTVEAAFRENTAERTFAMTLVAGFGLLALVLSVVGLYGLITYSVERQRREIGVRIALGAPPGSVVRSVLIRSLWLSTAGAALGLAAAVALARVVASLLYGISPVDATTYVVTAALVVTVALATAALPAARAARTDPLAALRSD
jgi:predicted permease